MTDEGFVRCVSLKRLSALDASHCSKLCNGSLIASLTLCPLKSLQLNGINFQPKNGKCNIYTNTNTHITILILILIPELSKMSIKTKMNILDLSFKFCSYVNADDVSYMLTAFPNCVIIDLTGCSQLNAVLEKLWNPHPFLKFTRTNEFFGIIINHHQSSS